MPEELDYEMWPGPAPAALHREPRPSAPSYDRPGWMRVRDYCEGMVTNWGAHLNDIAKWGNGTERTGPSKSKAPANIPGMGCGRCSCVSRPGIRYANGVRLFYNTSRPYIRFEGSEGWIEADYDTCTVKAQPESILTFLAEAQTTSIAAQGRKERLHRCRQNPRPDPGRRRSRPSHDVPVPTRPYRYPGGPKTQLGPGEGKVHQ